MNNLLLSHRSLLLFSDALGSYRDNVPPAHNDKRGSLQISANWIRDGSGCSHAGGGLPSSVFSQMSPPAGWGRDVGTVRQTGRWKRRQTDSEKGLAVCLGCAPPSPGFFWMVLWLLHSHTLYCASVLTDFFLHGMGMLYASHIPLSLAGSICCLLSLSFLHKSTAWMIRRPWLQVSFVCAHRSSCMKAGKRQRSETCIAKRAWELSPDVDQSALFVCTT